MKAAAAKTKAARKSGSRLREQASLPKRESAPRDQLLYLIAAGLAIATILIYVNSLANGFVFDDHELVGRPALKRLAEIPGLLTGSYRPLRDVSYAIDFAVWGSKAMGFHATNILIHVANTLMVFALARTVTREYIYAALGTLFFAVHPMQPDAVTYVAGRRDLLFTLFYLAAFHFYLAYRRYTQSPERPNYNKGRAVLLYAGFGVLWVLSLMSKEMAVSLPLFLFAWNFCEAWEISDLSWPRRFVRTLRASFARDKWLYIALVCAGAAFGLYTLFIANASVRVRGLEFNYWGGSFYTNVLTALRVHAWYLKQLVVPTPIVQYFGAFDVSSSFDWRAGLALLLVGGLITLGFVLLDRDRRLSFAIFSYFILLLPVSQIIPHHELLADHYLYLPLASFGLFVAVLVQGLSSRRRGVRWIAIGTAAAAITVLGAITVVRNRVYRDDLSLWTANYAEAPNSTRAVFNLAGQYAQRFPARAAELYERCIALDPSYTAAYINLAALYQTRDKARRMEELVNSGFALPDSATIGDEQKDPSRFRAGLLTALALSKGAQGDQKAAEDLLLKAIDTCPFLTEPYDLLALRYTKTDRGKEIAILRREVEANPAALQAAQYLAQALLDEKRSDEAEAYLKDIVNKWPDDFFANFQLGKIFQSRNDCAQAERCFIRAQAAAQAPDDAKTVELTLKGLAIQCK